MRFRAVSALGEIKDKRAVESLIEKLGRIEVFWRPNVVLALGETGDEPAIGPLQSLLGDGDVRVSTAARQALDKIPKKKAT